MKVRVFKQELADKSLDELLVKCNELRRELFGMRLNASTAHVKDYSQFKKLQRNIARVLTMIFQKKNSSGK